MLVVVARSSSQPDAMKRAAALTALAPMEISMRLAGVLPRVLLPAAPADTAADTAAALDGLGFCCFACEPTAAATDADRIVARSLDLQPDGFAAVDGQGQRHVCPPAAVAAFQRGTRIARKSETVKTSERRLDIGKVIVTGGLLMTSKVEKTTTKVTEGQEPFFVVERGDGEPDIIVYERRVDYRFLGTDMQASSRANLDTALARLRVLAPHAPLDDRLSRPGFISSLPLTSVDPVDLGLFLITLARMRAPA